MGQMLGQLRCGRCRNRFWPDVPANVVVLCPECGAGHANPEPWPLPGSPFVPNEHDKKMWEWTQRYWVGAVPYSGFSTPFGSTASTSGELDGYPFWAGRTVIRPEYPDAQRYTFIYVSVLPPPSRPMLPVNWSWAQAGVWAYFTRSVQGPELVGTMLPTLFATLRAAGAEPLLALEEVADPTPLDPTTLERELAVASNPRADAALESHPVQCGRCGAPNTAAELVAGRCPYCAALQSLDPGLQDALRQYRRRVHVAQLRASPGGFFDGFFGPLPPPAPGRVAMVCVRCGAPTQHRPGALDDRCRSCGAGLIPDGGARRTVSAEAAREGHRRQVSDQLDRQLAFGRAMDTMGIVQVVLLGLGIAPIALVGVGVLLYAVAEQRPVAALIALGVGGISVCGLVALVVKQRQNAKRKAATWRLRLTALAHQLGASSVGGSVDLRRWAEAWWNDRVAAWWLQDKPERGVIITQLAGFPVLMTAAIDVVGGLLPRTAPMKPHAVVLLGATLPRDVVYWAKRGEAMKMRAELERADFHLELRSGGLALQAGGRALSQIKKEPDRLAALAPIVFRLAQLAHHLRAEPPAAPEAVSAAEVEGVDLERKR